MADVSGPVQSGAATIAKKAAEEILKKAGIPGVGIVMTTWEFVKGMVEENVRKHLDKTRKFEGCPHVEACSEISGWTSASINAMTAAHLSFTAWQSKSGLWVYHPQHDYPPRFATVIYRPTSKDRDGLWSWTVVRNPSRGTGKRCHRCVDAWRGR